MAAQPDNERDRGLSPEKSTSAMRQTGCYYLQVFPISVFLDLFCLLVYALAAIAAGALTGVAASFLLGLPKSGILEDGLLGLFGFLVLSFTLTFVPAVGDVLSNRFVPPIIVALILAPVLPLLRELGRLIRYRWTSALVNRRLDQLRGQ